MKKYLLLLVVTIMFIVTGCSTDKKINYLEEGKTSLAAGEYENALNSFRLAINEGIADDSVKNMESMISKYLKAKKDYAEGKFQEAKTALEGISPDYVNFSIKSDIDSLKTDVDIKLKADNDEKLKAEEEKHKQEQEKLKAESQNSKGQLIAKGDYYNKKLASVKSGLKDIEGLYNGSTADMVEACNIEGKRWDKVLNEMYQDLKKMLPSDQFKTLQGAQRSWIKNRDSKADSEAAQFGGGSGSAIAYADSIAQSTRSRCYELLKYFK
ncbi:MAG: lysozyme inhibitor LprI family protein [Clostridium sp.]